MSIDFDQNLKAVLCCRIPVELKQKIHRFKAKYGIKTETESVIQILQAGLFVYDIEEKLQDPQIVNFLRSNLHNQMLVDWIFDLDRDRLEALYSAFKSARELRYTTHTRDKNTSASSHMKATNT